ncbi:MAG: hypothetical protein JWR63_1622, partial [Conexibacter sp.]|nr:hypothetical protein [Conexibacter sp.]
TSATSGSTTSTNASFAFTGADNASAVTFECKLDSGAYAVCTSPKAYTSVAVGSHTFSVRAKDAAGNVDASPATASWTVTTTSTPPPTPAGGLVAAYGFNETTGTTAADRSGNGLNGTITGAQHSNGGKFGGALTFNGTSDLVTVADNAKLQLTKGMTLEAWVAPSKLSGWSSVLFKEQTGDLAYGMYANTDANRPAGYAFTSAEQDVRSTAAQLPVNAWSHLATTYDGTTLRLYVNGTEVGSHAVSGAIKTSTGALRIGGNKVWGEWFAGRIDEVRVYNRALSSTEVKTDMNKAV